MHTPSYTIFYASDPQASAAWYAKLFGIDPVESAPTFVLFVLPHGYKFALWSSATVEPSPDAPGGGGEIIVSLDRHDEVDALFAAWADKDLAVLTQPTTLEFGRSFVVADPDGHRLRVLSLADDQR